MFGLGAMEIIVIVTLALLVLGPTRFPEAARGIGKAMREFRSATDGVKRDLTLTEPSRPRYAEPDEEPEDSLRSAQRSPSE